ncbi:30S ribosomal protein S3 [Candidatus Azambacteria bacterium]|nr:30S ribosomal protein S3 [Candidatus Azambacteria bacterium]
MGQKVHPIGLRLGIVANWKSRWFAPKKFRQYLKEDVKIRDYLMRKFASSAVDAVEIERSGTALRLLIKTARPGLIIGRGGTGIEEIRKEVVRLLEKLRGPKEKIDLAIEIQEIRKPEFHAMVMARQMAGELEKRIPFRRVMKQTLDRIMQSKEVEGAKVALAGRLGGAEMSRTEWLAKGKIPLHTLRANIDYAQTEARTTYGAIGIKVWIYKGEVFGEKEKGER